MTDLCPTCQLPATYTRELDRYIHDDGSDNRICWSALARGEVTAPLRDTDTAVLVDINPLNLRLNGTPIVRATTTLLRAVQRYAPNDAALAAVLRFLLAGTRESSTGDGELLLTDPYPALQGLQLWAQRDPDGYVLLLPIDA